MPARPIDWIQGPWSVHLHSLNRSSYSGLRLDNRIFPHWIISYVQDGDVITDTGKESHLARSGDVMIHPPNIPFTERSAASGTHLWMHAQFLCTHHFDLLQLYRVSPVVTLSVPGRYEAIFDKAFAAWDNPKLPFRDLTLTTCMLQLMEQILLSWDKAGRPVRSEVYDSTESRFDRLIGQMSLRLHEKLSRADLAALVRLNANYLDRAFQRQYGLSPMQMLREMRLNHSKQLLERSEEPLETIAEKCGLTDASYLCKQFKKQYGMLPGEYRESVRSAQSANLYGSTA